MERNSGVHVVSHKSSFWSQGFANSKDCIEKDFSVDLFPCSTLLEKQGYV